MQKHQQFTYVKNYYNLPFLRRGLRAVVDGKEGQVTSGGGAYVRIKLDGERHSGWYHPTDNVAYFSKDGKTLLADYRKEMVRA